MKSAPARRWIACADDYALDPGAVEAIDELLARGRLHATSVLSDAPLWPAAARQLAAAPADVGLHLNLTQSLRPRQASVWPLPALIARCWTGRLPVAPVREAIRRQLDAFEDGIGRAPDFVDGHQHVHQFPGVREPLLEELRARYPQARPWLRDTRPPPGLRDLKARGIGALGAAALVREALEGGFAVSAALVGVYGFDLERAALLLRLGEWIAAGGDRCVLMCHPATRAAAGDPIGAARRVEYELLASGAYEARMHAAGIALERGSVILDRALLPPPSQEEREGSGRRSR